MRAPAAPDGPRHAPRPFLPSLPAAAAGPAQPQPGTELVVEPDAGSQEREADRREEEFGETARITGFAEGCVQAEAFSGRILLRRFVNPAGRSTTDILANDREALAARGFTEEWARADRLACGNIADGGWNRRNAMNLGAGRALNRGVEMVPW
jgi:hypothetical protein